MTDTEALLAAALRTHVGGAGANEYDAYRAAGHLDRWWLERAKAILATPSGQKLLAPSERERALARHVTGLAETIEVIRDSESLDDHEWAAVDAEVAAARAALAQPDAQETK